LLVVQAYEQLQAALNLGRPVHFHGMEEHEEVHRSGTDEDYVHNAFNQFAGPDGSVQVGQVGEILELLNISLSPVQLQAATNQLDPNSTGFVARSDFLTWAKG
jgi:Ca2+-binding EF-hand superfamily protein